MLLGIIRGYINQYVTQYFENIDSSQLSGSVFYGAVLHNLNLRKTVLEHLGLPFHVVAGKCGTLEIQYTWYKLYTEPVIVKLKDLHILVVPARTIQYDTEAEKAAMQLEKQRQLEVFENMKHHMNEAHKRRSQPPTTPGGSAEPTSNPEEVTYFDQWVIPILNNIQFQIESIHLRFEDDFTKKLEPFAVGVTIQDLSVLSTDSAWNSQYVKEVLPETTFKLVTINGLSAYWNPAPTVMYKGIKEKETLFERLSALATSINQDPAFKTMLGPLSQQVKVQLSVSPDNLLVPFSKPRVRLDTNYEDLTCNVSDKQIKDIIPFLDTLDILWKGFEFRRFRPSLPEAAYKGHYREWWKFAYNCVMVDITRRRNNFRWSFIAEHRAKCSKYLRAFYNKVVRKVYSHELDHTIATLEEELDLFNLILLRKQVELIEKRPTRRSRQQSDFVEQPSYYTSAVNWLWSWWDPVPPPPPPPPVRPAPKPPQREDLRRSTEHDIFSVFDLDPEDKAELRVAVSFANNIDMVSYPVDYVDFDANALFQRIQVQIHKISKNQRSTVLDTILDNVSFQFQLRPRNDGMLVELRMGRLEAYGGDYPGPAASRDSLLTSTAPQLLTTANRSSQEYFFKFCYERFPPNSDSPDPPDHKITLEGLALQFIYNADVIQKIVECFHVHKRGEPKIIGPIPTARVLRQLFDFRNYPTSKVLRMMENKGKVELNVCLISPRVVIPQELTNRRKASFFVVELGTINLVGTIIGGTICEHGGCSTLM